MKRDSIDVGSHLLLLICWVCCPRLLNTV